MKDVRVHCILPLSQCRGQAYDGASYMSGHLLGVAAQIKSEQPAALHVHCLAHCFNLCLQDAARICHHVRDALELIIELVKLIKYSPKRSSLFQSLKSQVSPDTSDIRPLCPTRWTVCTGAIGAVLSNYSTLCTVLEEVNSTGRDEYAMKAGGILRMLEKFATFLVSNCASWCLAVQSNSHVHCRVRTQQSKKPKGRQCLPSLTLNGKEMMILLRSFMSG